MFNRSFFANLPPVTKNLFILNLIVWAFIALTPASTGEKVIELGGLHYISSPGFGLWQLFTYMFIHKELWHLFFNMWALLMFGYAVEQRLGSKQFLIYYIVCGIGAAIVQLGVFAIMINHLASHISTPDYNAIISSGWEILQNGYNFSNAQLGELNILLNSATIGASGAVFGILLAFGMYFPNTQMYIMFIPYAIKAKWVVVGYGILELILGFASQHDGIAHFAHLGGMFFGFILLWYWRKKQIRDKWDEWRS